jgi:hypothetical protein
MDMLWMECMAAMICLDDLPTCLEEGTREAVRTGSFLRWQWQQLNVSFNLVLSEHLVYTMIFGQLS